MASIEVKQREERAINELDEAKRVLQEFKESATQGKLLETLRVSVRRGEDLKAVQQQLWEKLEEKEKRLEEDV